MVAPAIPYAIASLVRPDADGSGNLLPVHGLTAADVPADISREAARPYCCVEAGSDPGFGYLGGGFGPYKRCKGCGKPFAKTGPR